MRTQIDTEFLSKEDLVLLHCARTDDAYLHEIRDALGSELDWEYLTMNALYHGVAPLLYRSLERIDDSSLIPKRAIAVLRERYYITLARNMIHYDELKTALCMFADAKIDVIVLKGGALAETVYRDIGLRPFSDVDILVTFVQTPGIFGFLELKEYLEYLLQCPVDLVTRNALKYQFREQILQEALHAV